MSGPYHFRVKLTHQRNIGNDLESNKKKKKTEEKLTSWQLWFPSLLFGQQMRFVVMAAWGSLQGSKTVSNLTHAGNFLLFFLQ